MVCGYKGDVATGHASQCLCVWCVCRMCVRVCRVCRMYMALASGQGPLNFDIDDDRGYRGYTLDDRYSNAYMQILLTICNTYMY